MEEVPGVVTKVEHYFGELFPPPGFIVTNLHLPNQEVVRLHNCRRRRPQAFIVSLLYGTPLLLGNSVWTKRYVRSSICGVR